ncbi:hypothetical protein [Kitasatospora sp. NPDC088783]|uniref:hypothetical protein n=1 Tax=Kitasatospora sp. NPDC088783 TaxID=3364077 RepID=UPI00382ED872
MSSEPAPAPVPPAGGFVQALVEGAVGEVVRTASPDAVEDLVAGLEESGLLWDGVLALLGPLAARPAHGSQERGGRGRAAWTPDRVTLLTYTLGAALRDRGVQAAREEWEGAEERVRRAAAAQMLITYAFCVGGHGVRLGPGETVRLLRAAVPVTW